MQPRCGGSGLREVGATPGPSAGAAGVDEAGGGPPYGDGGATQTVGGGQRESQAAAKRKMAVVPPLSKAELLKVRELSAKPQWVYAILLALSTLLWRRKKAAHKYVTRFRDKDKFTDVTLDDRGP